MAHSYKTSQISYFFIYLSILSCCFLGLTSANVDLDEDNWRQILDGEWMVEFYAPWCPACNALAPAWRELSSRATRKSLAMRAAAVDVTKSPGLSGRFVVTALPTIFHVKNSEFRQYKGPRDVDSMLSYVEHQKWKQTDPVSAWKAPHSLQMTLVAEFFKLSQALRSVHTFLMEQYGLPTWGSYLIFAIATIVVGALLGLILVCIIDLLYPPKRADKVLITQADLNKLAQGDQDKDKADDEEELINDDILDDAEKSKDSDAEKNSEKDSDEDENPKTEGAGDDKNKDVKSKDEEAENEANDKDSDKPTEVRKRRPRKAD